MKKQKEELEKDCSFKIPTPAEWRKLREQSGLRPTDIIQKAKKNLMNDIYRLEAGKNVSIWQSKRILEIYKSK